jgi:hypothetical protein
VLITSPSEGLKKSNMNVRIKSNVAVSDSGFVFDPSTGDSYSVNPIGVEIIQLLKEKSSTDDVLKSILERYETDEKTIDKDLFEFIQLLLNLQLAEKV